MTALRFPAEIAVGEVWWEDAREPDGSGHLLAIGVVEVPGGTAVDLSVYTVAEVSVSGQPGGMFVVPAGTGSPPAVPLRRRHRRRSRERVTWQRGMPDSVLRNNRSIWGGPGDLSYSVASGEEAVDLEFIRGLPADSVFDLSVGRVDPDSFAAVAHLAPGLRRLGVTKACPKLAQLRSRQTTPFTSRTPKSGSFCRTCPLPSQMRRLRRRISYCWPVVWAGHYRA